MKGITSVEKQLVLETEHPTAFAFWLASLVSYVSQCRDWNVNNHCLLLTCGWYLLTSVIPKHIDGWINCIVKIVSRISVVVLLLALLLR